YANGSLVAANVVCGPPPTLQVASPAHHDGKFWFIKSASNGSPAATDRYLIDISADPASGQPTTVSLSASRSDLFGIDEGTFYSGQTNYVSLETIAACGATGYSNEVSVYKSANPPGSGCIQEELSYRDVAVQHLTIGADETCQGTQYFNHYYRPTQQAQWVKLNLYLTTNPILTLIGVPPGAGNGFYQTRRYTSAGQLLESGPELQLRPQSARSESVAQGGAPAVTPRYYHLDHLGSSRLLTDSLGNTISHHDYYPYGMSRTYTGPDPVDPTNTRQYTGHEFE